MAYVPTEWATGDVITAEKLNNIENGIVNNNNYSFIVTITDININQNTCTFDKTWNEMKAAFANGKRIILRNLTKPTPVYSQYTTYELKKYALARDTTELYSLTFDRIDVITANLIHEIEIVIESESTSYVETTVTIPTN